MEYGVGCRTEEVGGGGGDRGGEREGEGGASGQEDQDADLEANSKSQERLDRQDVEYDESTQARERQCESKKRNVDGEVHSLPETSEAETESDEGTVTWETASIYADVVFECSKNEFEERTIDWQT